MQVTSPIRLRYLPIAIRMPTGATSLRACYGVSGTEVQYGATGCAGSYGRAPEHGTPLCYLLRLASSALCTDSRCMLLCWWCMALLGVWYRCRVWCYRLRMYGATGWSVPRRGMVEQKGINLLDSKVEKIIDVSRSHPKP
eukprot:2753085-Rhodomonas_salina.1